MNKKITIFFIFCLSVLLFFFRYNFQYVKNSEFASENNLHLVDRKVDIKSQENNFNIIESGCYQAHLIITDNFRIFKHSGKTISLKILNKLDNSLVCRKKLSSNDSLDLDGNKLKIGWCNLQRGEFLINVTIDQGNLFDYFDENLEIHLDPKSTCP